MNSENFKIDSFSVAGLPGGRRIDLDFTHPYKIIIAENGTGKTTALNCLFYCLTGRFHKL